MICIFTQFDAHEFLGWGNFTCLNSSEICFDGNFFVVDGVKGYFLFTPPLCDTNNGLFVYSPFASEWREGHFRRFIWIFRSLWRQGTLWESRSELSRRRWIRNYFSMSFGTLNKHSISETAWDKPKSLYSIQEANGGGILTKGRSVLLNIGTFSCSEVFFSCPEEDILFCVFMYLSINFIVYFRINTNAISLNTAEVLKKKV